VSLVIDYAGMGSMPQPMEQPAPQHEPQPEQPSNSGT
jgi:hypothetical protein